MLLAKWQAECAGAMGDYRMLEIVAEDAVEWYGTDDERLLYKEYVQFLLRRISTLESQIESLRESAGEQIRASRIETMQ